MAITLVGRPEDFTPVYNQVNFYVDSNKKNEKGFRYVFDLFDAETNVKLSETRGAPRPNDGFGESKLSRLLAPHVTRKFNPTELLSGSAEENYVRYKLQIGEEYVAQWSYDDYEFYNNSNSIYFGYVQLREFTTVPANAHDFSVGDQIDIVQSDGGALKPALSGLHTIVAIPNDWTIVIDLEFAVIGSGAAVAGDITFADNRKVVERNLLEETGVAYNGAFGVQEFRVLSSDIYKVNVVSPNRRILTTLPEAGFKVVPDADMWVNYVKADADFLVGAFYAYFENSNGDVFRKIVSTGNTAYIWQFYAGTNDSALQLLTGTAGLIKPDTEWYEFYLTSFSGDQASVKYRVGIDRRCVIEEHIVLFEDRVGSFIPMAFQLHSEETTEYEREQYKQELGDLIVSGDPARPGRYGYNSYDEGMTTVSVLKSDTFLLRSNWMSRVEYEYFKELLGSPTTYLLLNGVYVSCKLETLSTMTRGRGSRKIVRKDLVVMLSNQDEVNI